MRRIAGIILLFLTFSRAAEIPFNLGLGPTLHFIPGVLEQDGPYSGFSIDLYAALTHEFLEQNIDKVPKRFRRYVKGTHEIHYKPGLLGWLPTQFVVHYSPRYSGMYGGTISLLSLGSTLGKSRTVIPRLAVQLPTVTYLYLDSDLLEQNQNFLGLGGSALAELKLAFSQKFQVALRWDSHLYAPLPTSELQLPGGAKETLWHHGALSLLLNFRIPVNRKI